MLVFMAPCVWIEKDRILGYVRLVEAFVLAHKQFRPVPVVTGSIHEDGVKNVTLMLWAEVCDSVKSWRKYEQSPNRVLYMGCVFRFATVPNPMPSKKVPVLGCPILMIPFPSVPFSCLDTC